MYHKAYGIIETLAPLHIGASAGEETGNLNLIFRDQFTQTGIIPGSSIRGRFRADMRPNSKDNERKWYGHEAISGEENKTTEALIKFEYASLVWLPVFCPGQPIVWITCPRLLKRYKQIASISAEIPKPYSAPKALQSRQVGTNHRVLFFNLGFIEIEHDDNLTDWIPSGTDFNRDNLLVVADNDIAMLHDMALYRQSRVKLADSEKKVEGGAFFNVEALPEGSVLVFPIALKETGWQPFGDSTESQDLYFGGLESIGFGHCRVKLAGDY
ncbi:uncharacterized protein predicted to be involved in DNA repair (RAMP superfamily) [Rivularia sp. PCC 7116]|uniref:RAMP superfamily CRISPR-associated protein n=1 Tax=Rivularia sp. PCC 7116 TaxID=373994 RepID=UPI00029EDEEF|nr:RAMP superfamily CRISPR-associated protein [Rivularia sp. PCC 7116]AFY57363.1 uncharacterized protein predicted to be involved in DNA repair (RAMP superfamily) [Rivularia sp. PCC 7116]